MLLRAVAALPLRRAVARRPLPGAVPLPSNLLDPPAAREQLVLLSAALAREGAALIERILPSPPKAFSQWTHYPQGDAIDPASKARWFYHAHPPEQRDPGEHGHFHIFLPLAAFDGVQPIASPEKEGGAKVVHVAALCFDTDGLPTNWIATNQWVTQEHLFPAQAIIARLDLLCLDGAGEGQGISHVGRWLSLALQMCRADIIDLLQERDQALARSAGPHDRKAEVLARRRFAF